MDIRKLQRVIVDGLEDVKAQNIVVFNTEHLSPLFERVIVASGTSNRQTRSLAASVRDAVKSAGAPAPRTEGEDNGEWIIVDCGAGTPGQGRSGACRRATRIAASRQRSVVSEGAGASQRTRSFFTGEVAET